MASELIQNVVAIDEYTLKGAPIAKFRLSTLEFGHQTPTIRFVVPQNPGSNGRNYRFEHRRETGAILIFWREYSMWTFLGQQRLVFDVKFTLNRWNGSQGTIFCQEKLEKNKTQFLTIFFLKILRFFRHFFCSFFNFSIKYSTATAI